MLTSTFRIAGSFLLLLLVGAGCSAASDGEENAESASLDLVTVVRLDEITSSELRAAAIDRFEAKLEVLTTQHPDVAKVSTANIGTFVETRTPAGSTPSAGVIVNVDHEAADAIRSLFTFTESTELSIAKIKSTYPTWLDQQLPGTTTASGKVRCDLAAAHSRSIGAACHAAEDAKALATAAKPRGVNMASFAETWTAMMGDGAGATFVRPVKLVGGDPSNAEVKRLTGIVSWCPQRAWGTEAVDAYVSRHSELDGFRGGLSGSGIKKRWYWACGSDDWGADAFAVLDEHDQLWAFTTYSSE